MDAILLVLRSGMQWNALTATGMCFSSAHRRFHEWEQAGVFAESAPPRVTGIPRGGGDRLVVFVG